MTTPILANLVERAKALIADSKIKTPIGQNAAEFAVLYVLARKPEETLFPDIIVSRADEILEKNPLPEARADRHFGFIETCHAVEALEAAGKVTVDRVEGSSKLSIARIRITLAGLNKINSDCSRLHLLSPKDHGAQATRQGL